jgi:hypothetical protein
MIKQKNIAVVTSLFDYPDHYFPTFYNKIKHEISDEDIHIIRSHNLIQSKSYYDKLYFYKIEIVRDYILKHIVNEYEFILFLDATDTALIKNFDGIINKFKSMNCSILFGAEKGLWPSTNYSHLYENKKIESEYKYLNSGTYIGYTDKILLHLNDIIEKQYQKGIDDQGHWSIQYLLNDDILIDQKCDIFFSTYKSKNKIIINNNIVELLDVGAYIIHDNGPHDDETIKLIDRFI